MRLTKNFYLYEFASGDGEPYPEKWIKPRLIPLCKNLEVVRAYFGGKKVIVKSGFRTWAHHVAIYENLGKPPIKNSRHLFGDAVDYVIEGVHPKEVGAAVEELIRIGEMQEGGLGKNYSTFTHYDIRGHKARW